MPVSQYSSAPYAGQIEAAASMGVVAGVNFSGATVDGAASSVNINGGAWHYVAASYLQSPTGGSSGTMEIYIDGLQVAAGCVGSTALATPGACWLGPNATRLDFASWSIWSTAIASDLIDVPEWGAPAAGDEADSGLVAAFDFAQIGALVASGGRLIAWKVTQMAVAIGMLVNDLLHMPTGGAQLSAGNGAGAAGASSRPLAATEG